MLKLKDILKPDGILEEVKSPDKRGVLQEFSDLASKMTQIDKEVVLNILLNREKLGSTAVGHGVAIPHGKIAGLDQIVALFGRSRKGVDFQAHDQKPSQLFFVILAPEAAIGNYLHALARLSRLMKDERIRDYISKCDIKDIYQVLVAEDEKI
jgi:PTS system nitrogen regulatory IIA component